MFAMVLQKPGSRRTPGALEFWESSSKPDCRKRETPPSRSRYPSPLLTRYAPLSAAAISSSYSSAYPIHHAIVRTIFIRAKTVSCVYSDHFNCVLLYKVVIDVETFSLASLIFFCWQVSHSCPLCETAFSPHFLIGFY